MGGKMSSVSVLKLGAVTTARLMYGRRSHGRQIENSTKWPDRRPLLLPYTNYFLFAYANRLLLTYSKGGQYLILFYGTAVLIYAMRQRGKCFGKFPQWLRIIHI